MESAFIGTQKCIANEKCEFVHISDKYLRLVGYSRQEIRDQFHNSFFEMVYPEDLDTLRENFSRQLLSSDSFSIDYRVQTKAGKPIWLHDQGKRVTEDGVDFYYCEISDATRYYNLDSYYKGLLNALPNPIIVLDNDLRITFINQSVARDTGISAHEAYGKPCTVFQTPLCGTENCCIKRYLRGDSAAVQYTPDGRINRVSFTPQYNAEGKQIGYISISTDVTELVQTEKELRLSEERYRIALQQTKNTIWEFDIAAKTSYRADASHSAGQNRYTNVPESLIASGAVHPDSVKEIRKMYEAILRGEKTASCTARIRDAAGNYRWLELTSSTVFDEDGVPLRAIGTARDVSAEKEREQQFIQERQYRDSLVSDAIYTYEANLTQDKILRITSGWANLLGVKEMENYSSLIHKAQERAVHPNYRQYIMDILGRNSLLEAFRNGRREVSCEYQQLDNDGEMIWVCNTVYLIQSEVSGDICAFIYLKDIDHQKRQALELQKKAERDQLTGLFNRTASRSLIDRILGDTKGRPCAMFMLDIDNFKQINDTYGHLFGDAVLSETAARLSTLFRKGDVLGRLGGDEFLIFLQGIPNEELALRKAEQVCRQVRSVYSSGGRQCEISGSVGIAFSPRDGGCFDTLYERADIALYHAKDQGKNQFAVYQEGLWKNLVKPLSPRLSQEKNLAKSFSENIGEYIFKILYNARDLDLSVNAVLELLCKHYNTRRSYIVEYDAENDAFSMTFEWCDQGFPSAKGWMQGISLGKYWERFDEDGVFLLEDISGADPALEAIVRRVGSCSLIQCAMVSGGRFRGFLGVDEDRCQRAFSEEERSTLLSAGEIISTFLLNQRNEAERLRLIETLQTLLDKMPNAVYVVEQNTHRLVYCNRRLLRIFPDAMSGRPCYETFRGFSSPCRECPMSGIGGKNESSTEDIYNERLNVWIKTTATRIKWPGAGEHFMLNCVEVTKYKDPKQEE
ncbi:MAG: diguanylate cyclase domain-containing protein [Anaerotruncus rubiinfantis]|uniref:diguanylate cyclase domain-containing protein n=1 Tax=Anaerotruncus rubiinfantis TaxID=1720200 RepID=UPI0018991EBD|nr:diguanylate cyclase [Anaerotruncus rubiinfantis]